MNSKSLSFTDMQLALLSNAMILAALSVQKLTSRSDAQYFQVLHTAWHSVDSFPASAMKELINMLQVATANMGTTPNEAFRQVKLTDNIPQPGYVPQTGPFNAIPRTWDDLNDNEKEAFLDYFDSHGFHHEHDPRAN